MLNRVKLLGISIDVMIYIPLTSDSIRIVNLANFYCHFSRLSVRFIPNRKNLCFSYQSRNQDLFRINYDVRFFTNREFEVIAIEGRWYRLTS